MVIDKFLKQVQPINTTLTRENLIRVFGKSEKDLLDDDKDESE